MYAQTKTDLNPSSSLALLVSLPYLAAAYLLSLSALSPLIILPVLALLILSYVKLIKTTCYLVAKDSITSVSISETSIKVECADGQLYSANLHQALIYQALVCLSIDIEDSISDNLLSKFKTLMKGKHRYIIVSRLNTSDPQSFRRFKALLNMCHHQL